MEGAVRSLATAVGKRLAEGMDQCVQRFNSSIRRHIPAWEPAGPGEAASRSTLSAASQHRAVVVGHVARCSLAQRKGAPPPPRAPPHRLLESWPRGACLRVQMAAAGRGSANWQPPPPPPRPDLKWSGSPLLARIGSDIRIRAPEPGRVASPHCGREGTGAGEPGVLPRSLRFGQECAKWGSFYLLLIRRDVGRETRDLAVVRQYGWAPSASTRTARAGPPLRPVR